MIKTTAMLVNELKDYKAPNNKILNMVKNNELFPIIRGLYETDGSTSGYLLASSICNPSYLSFEFALSFYGLIPEAVYTFTSATFGKNKRKTYNTPFGNFTYRDIPKSVYPYGIDIRHEGVYSFLIADREKAICDKLYTLKPVSNMSELENMLFDNLRIEREEFYRLDFKKMTTYSELYNATNLDMLIKLLRRLSNDNHKSDVIAIWVKHKLW